MIYGGSNVALNLSKSLKEKYTAVFQKKIPKVTWTVKVIDREFVNRIPVIVKMLVGHVDNSEYPLINVAINMMLVVPMNVKGPVPALMMFSGRPSFIFSISEYRFSG